MENIDMFEVLLGFGMLYMAWLLAYMMDFNDDVINEGKKSAKL
jgi:hypothetical protein